MGEFIAGKVLKLLNNKGKKVRGSKCLMLGITFKENCPDIRNTRAIDIYKELLQYGVDVDIYDPWASNEEVIRELNVRLIDTVDMSQYESVILAVSHNEFAELDYSAIRENEGVIFDVKAFLPREIVDARL